MDLQSKVGVTLVEASDKLLAANHMNVGGDVIKMRSLVSEARRKLDTLENIFRAQYGEVRSDKA